MKSWIIPAMSILSITGITCYALSLGINGVLFALAVAAVSGIGGYKIKSGLVK